MPQGGTTMSPSGRPEGAMDSMPGTQRAARVALLLSVQAFFEAELLGSKDAREWLEGPHPGPVQWATYPAGRATTRVSGGRSAP